MGRMPTILEANQLARAGDNGAIDANNNPDGSLERLMDTGMKSSCT